MKKLILILTVSIWSLLAQAQELKCNVTVNSNQVAQVERSIFDELQKGINEFMNNTKWTDLVFEEAERIEVGIFINVTDQEKDNTGKVVQDKYKGTITIQARRPVYNSTYNCQLLNFQDNDFTFSYIPFQQFYYSKNASLSNLTSVLAYYAYLIIGLDSETFELKGGEPYLLEAQAIVNNAQNLGDRGWRASEGNSNRYWLVNDYLNPAFAPLRELMYNYHRLGYDLMSSKLDEGRKQVIASLKTLDQVWTQRPNSFLLQVFFNAKRNEIIDMLKGTPLNDKADVLKVLKKTDPANSSKYDVAAN